MYYIYLFKNFSPISLSAFFNEISKNPFISEVIDIPSLIDCFIFRFAITVVLKSKLIC